MESSSSSSNRSVGNGPSSRPPPPLGVVVKTREPLSRVMDLGGKTTMVIVLALALAVVVHGSAAARVALIATELLQWTQVTRLRINERLAATYEVEAPKEEKPPEPEPVKEEPKDEPKLAPPPKDTPKDTAPPPPPAAAQAGAVLTQQPDPNEPVDFTNSFVSGSSATYAGGVTQANGTNDKAVYDRHAQAGGVPGGTGTAPAPPAPVGPDRSRNASIAGSKQWNCPWPAEADTEQIDSAVVGVEMTISADGKLVSFKVTKDPGHGFGREARLCAQRERYESALDRDGRPVSQVRKLNITFER